MGKQQLNQMGTASEQLLRHYKDLSYRLIQSRRKSISISIAPNLQITVRSPLRFPIYKIEGILEKKQLWIQSKLAQFGAIQKINVFTSFNEGDTQQLLGEPYPIIHVKQARRYLIFTGYAFELKETALTHAKRHFIKLYKRIGLKVITEKLNQYEKLMEVKAERLRILDLRGNWGSCSFYKKAVNFHWKCLLLPEEILDYIVVHELAHLTHPNHSKDFWNRVAAFIPDYKTRRKSLKQYNYVIY